MASQHHPIKNGARGNGAKHSRYIGGEGPFSDRADVIHCEDANLPSWAKSADDFFAAADEYERAESKPTKHKTKDGIEYEKTNKGRAYKEMEVAIPREAKDPVRWAKDFARESLGDKHPYRLAVHDKEAKDGGRNVHMHLMFSTRTMDGHERDKETFFKRANTGSYYHRASGERRPHDPAKGGAKKSDYWNSREAVRDHRARFEQHVQRVAPDFKLERSEAPEQKIGPSLKKAGPEYEKQRQERLDNVSELRAAKAERRDIDAEIKREQEIENRLLTARASGEAERKEAPQSIINLGTDIEAARRDRDREPPPKSRTAELMAQLERQRKERDERNKERENPLAAILQQRQADKATTKNEDKQPQKGKTMENETAAPEQAIEQQPQQLREQDQEQPRSRTAELLQQQQQERQQREQERERDGGPELSR